MKKPILNVKVWAKGDVIRSFVFSDGCTCTGDDAHAKFDAHLAEVKNKVKVGKMKIVQM